MRLEVKEEANGRSLRHKQLIFKNGKLQNYILSFRV